MSLRLVNINMFKLFTYYILLIIFVSGTFLWIFQMMFPDISNNMQSALFSSFGLKVPQEVLRGELTLSLVLVVSISVILSVMLILINIYFGAVITTKLIRPSINILTSKRGVLSTHWEKSGKPYILVRLINANKFDLVKVNITAVVTIEEHVTHPEYGNKTFIYFFSVTDMDPMNILILKSKSPWTIAIPADIKLSNSINDNYTMEINSPITKSAFPEYTLLYAKRKIEFLITGSEAESSSAFIDHEEVYIDEQNGDDYNLLLHEGRFQELDIVVNDPTEIEQYV